MNDFQMILAECDERARQDSPLAITTTSLRVQLILEAVRSVMVEADGELKTELQAAMVDLLGRPTELSELL